MDEITSKEKILKAIRNGLMNHMENPYADVNTDQMVMHSIDESIDVYFAQELSKLGGKFIFCDNDQEVLDILIQLLQEDKIGPIFCVNPIWQNKLAQAGIEYLYKEEDLSKTKSGITECEFLIARFGSVLMSSGLPSGRRLYAWPEIHLVIAYASQLVPEISDAIIGMRETYNGILPSMMTLVSGPSRTADIEKTLVMGAHGPRELFVFYIDDLME